MAEKNIEVTNLYLDSIPKSKIEALIKELDKEYKKSQKAFDKLYEKEKTDMQEYCDMREALTIMQTTSHLRGKLGELLGG